MFAIRFSKYRFRYTMYREEYSRTWFLPEIESTYICILYARPLCRIDIGSAQLGNILAWQMQFLPIHSIAD
jgi:hypothetical protein